MHSFNDSVVYVRNGKSIPAIVLSSLQSDRGELLTVLYAQPEIGPTLLAQGTTRGIAQVQQAVAPFVEGNVFGWHDEIVDLKDVFSDAIMPHLIELSKTVATIAPKMEISPTGTIISANTLLQECLLKTPESAPEQLDEAQGPVEPGDPESPHAIETSNQVEKQEVVHSPVEENQTLTLDVDHPPLVEPQVAQS